MTPDRALPDEMDAAKLRLRAALRARAGEVRDDHAATEGSRAVAALERDARWRDAARIGLFASSRGEPDTRPIFDAVIASGRAALLPRCPTHETMEFVGLERWDDLRPGRYGLPEPLGEAPCEPWAQGDVVIVPAMGLDRSGGRLGRGGGHYDRCFGALPRGAPWLVGFGFPFQIVEAVPMDRHDRRLDGVLAGGELTWLDL